MSFPLFRSVFQSGGDIKFVNSMPGLRNLGPRGIMRRRIGMSGKIQELIVMAKDNPQIIGRPFSKVNMHVSIFATSYRFLSFRYTIPITLLSKVVHGHTTRLVTNTSSISFSRSSLISTGNTHQSARLSMTS